MSAKIELDHRIHVLTRKEELDGVRVPGKVVVVLDILFATTTMVAALAHGATEVVPVADESAARDAGRAAAAGQLRAVGRAQSRRRCPASRIRRRSRCCEHGVRGKALIYSTTNGTVAMTLAAGAKRVYCGSLLNAGAVAAHIAAPHPRDTVLILCSGSGGNFNLEDFYGAGCVVDRFARRARCGRGLLRRRAHRACASSAGAGAAGAARVPCRPHDGQAWPRARGRIRLPDRFPSRGAGHA